MNQIGSGEKLGITFRDSQNRWFELREFIKKAFNIRFEFPKCSLRRFNARTYRLLLQPYPSVKDFASPEMLNHFIQSSRLPSDFVAGNLGTDSCKHVGIEMGHFCTKRY